MYCMYMYVCNYLPVWPEEEEAKKNKTSLFLLVVLLLFCCCCCSKKNRQKRRQKSKTSSQEKKEKTTSQKNHHVSGRIEAKRQRGVQAERFQTRLRVIHGGDWIGFDQSRLVFQPKRGQGNTCYVFFVHTVVYIFEAFFDRLHLFEKIIFSQKRMKKWLFSRDHRTLFVALALVLVLVHHQNRVCFCSCSQQRNA